MPSHFLISLHYQEISITSLKMSVNYTFYESDTLNLITVKTALNASYNDLDTFIVKTL